MNLIFNLVYTLKVILVNPHEQQKYFTVLSTTLYHISIKKQILFNWLLNQTLYIFNIQ